MNKTLIIAEAGVNHNGSIDLAKRLIDVAAEAGVDFVKFQTFKAEKLVAKDAKKAEYQVKNIGGSDDSQFIMLKRLELDLEAHLILFDYCKSKNIKFLSTAFDLESIDLLDRLGLELYKIPSGEITNFPYLKRIAGKGKPIILSTGMSDLGEIEDAVDICVEGGTEKDLITVLHCNTEYPTPMKDVNLKAMITIGQALGVKVGYSDHTLGIEIPIAAVALGALCIEKHFTLDKNMEGPDHKASLEPDELKEMVRAIRNIEQALGNGIKKPSDSEKKNKEIARKSIHLAKALNSGDTISENDLIMKRPGSGIPPSMIDYVVGKRLLKNLVEDHKLSFNDFQ
jgi:N,N'-diacetyllegionaminate synthase